jgi:hypothetical protein
MLVFLFVCYFAHCFQDCSILKQYHQSTSRDINAQLHEQCTPRLVAAATSQHASQASNVKMRNLKRLKKHEEYMSSLNIGRFSNAASDSLREQLPRCESGCTSAGNELTQDELQCDVGRMVLAMSGQQRIAADYSCSPLELFQCREAQHGQLPIEFGSLDLIDETLSSGFCELFLRLCQVVLELLAIVDVIALPQVLDQLLELRELLEACGAVQAPLGAFGAFGRRASSVRVDVRRSEQVSKLVGIESHGSERREMAKKEELEVCGGGQHRSIIHIALAADRVIETTFKCPSVAAV